MRQRYTILTVVDSACRFSTSGDGDGDPPHVFILFKGKKNGKIERDLNMMTDIPPWLHIQVQEFGSYREEDMIEALRILLPVARHTYESKVVLLDWFAAHRTPVVIAFIENRGHVVLFHGGGCTPFTQINDTHLHALLARLLLRLENKLSHAERVDMHMNNKSGVPSLSRPDIVGIVMTAWRMLDHKRIAQTGYLQTGPGLPMTGPIRRDWVYKDLRTVWDQIDPPVGMQEMGQKLRDDAAAFVANGYPHKWSRWEHVKRLIAEHDEEDDPLPEGLECVDYVFPEDEESDDEDSDDHCDGPGGGDDGEDDDDDDFPGAGGVEEIAAEPAADIDMEEVAVEPAAVKMDVARAREVLIEEARRTRDDLFLRRLLRQRDESNSAAKAAATDAARVLQKNALAELEERRKKREHAKIEQRQARLDEELAAQRKAEAQERQSQLKLSILKETGRQHREGLLRARDEKIRRQSEQWIQTEYPRLLAQRLACAMPAEQRSVFKSMVKKMSEQRWFRWMPALPMLWEVDQHLLIRHSSVLQFEGGPARVVRCSATFHAYLDEVDPVCIGGDHLPAHKDALNALRSLLDKTTPGAHELMFTGRKCLHRQLHLNDYVLDKTFVGCIILVSKWLTEKKFPSGVYAWPPQVPQAMLPASPPLPEPSSKALPPMSSTASY